MRERERASKQASKQPLFAAPLEHLRTHTYTHIHIPHNLSLFLSLSLCRSSNQCRRELGRGSPSRKVQCHHPMASALHVMILRPPLFVPSKIAPPTANNLPISKSQSSSLPFPSPSFICISHNTAEEAWWWGWWGGRGQGAGGFKQPHPVVKTPTYYCLNNF